MSARDELRNEFGDVGSFRVIVSEDECAALRSYAAYRVAQKGRSFTYAELARGILGVHEILVRMA